MRQRNGGCTFDMTSYFTNLKFSRASHHAMLTIVPAVEPSPVTAPPRLLILTASFGDGHNSAARGLAEAARQLAGDTVRVDVRDLIRESQPVVSRMLEKAYAATITHAAWAWRQFYRTAGRLPLENDPLRALEPVRLALAAELRRDPPATIACTFPVYPHLLHRLLGRSSLPVHTIVTDSITIHPVWRCDSVRTYFAADEISASLLRPWAGPGTEVVDSGFPVSPAFARLPAEPAQSPPRTALFFAASDGRTFARSLRSLLRDGPPELALTLVLGRHANRLGPVAQSLAAEYPHRRVHILGWTTDVPHLMTTHDLVIAKAGGATTHETAAAGRPNLIVKVVPGQEEGNVELVQRRGSGLFEDDPDALGPLLRSLVASGEWSRLRDAAWRHRRPLGAFTAARHVLASLSSNQ
jgi:processive 1,2-diacylglycerol beta-glucosyltransferase